VSSVFELVCGLVLSAAAVVLVLRPIFVPPPPLSGTQASDDDGEDPDDDLSPRAVALRALKEIEFDRATGKLADNDYNALKSKYTSEALAALREENTGTPVLEARPAIPPAEAPASCPIHGARPEPDARFCSECGRQLTGAASYCARCGNPLATGMRFCASCGRRVAA
jgi:hypothetical protein